MLVADEESWYKMQRTREDGSACSNGLASTEYDTIQSNFKFEITTFLRVTSGRHGEPCTKTKSVYLCRITGHHKPTQ
jgi:hypothetical protein